MTTMEEMEVLLGEARAEAVVLKDQKADLEAALGAMEAERTKEMQRANAATKSLNDHLEELKRAGVAAQKLLGSLEEQLQAGDALRNRLLKVTVALAAIDRYFLLLEGRASAEELEEAKKAYMLAKAQLGTFDDSASKRKVDIASIPIDDIQAMGIYLSMGAPPSAYIRTGALGYVAVSDPYDVDLVRRKLEEKLRGRRPVNDNQPDQVSDGR